jgi:hypothetical protein
MPSRVADLKETPAYGRPGFVVPRGVVHCTRAPQQAVILMVENAGIVPTGD